jgi:hypothetical protein
VALRPAEFDRDVLALDETGLAEAAAKCSYKLPERRS